MLNDDNTIKGLRLAKVEQIFPRTGIGDVKAFIREKLDANKSPGLKPGMRIAVAVGSRGIRNIDIIARETVDYLKQQAAVRL